VPIEEEEEEYPLVFVSVTSFKYYESILVINVYTKEEFPS
jgi:hypothetical protein